MFPTFPRMLGTVNNEEARKLVGAAVVRRREQLGISQIELARQAGVDPKTLRSLETGAREIQIKSRAAIVAALGWPPGALDRVRSGDEPDSPPVRPNSVDSIVETVLSKEGANPTPQQLRELRKALEESEIHSLPTRVAQLSYPSKVQVNELVTRLEDEEYEERINRDVDTTPPAGASSEANQDKKTDDSVDHSQDGRLNEAARGAASRMREASKEQRKVE